MELNSWNYSKKKIVVLKRFHVIEIDSYPRYLITGEYSLNIVLRSTHAERIHNATQEVVELIRSHGEEEAVE